MIKRPRGVTVIGCTFVFLGGLAILVIIIDIIMWVSNFGVHSITVSSLWGLRNFISMLIFPICVYSAGIAMLLLRRWVITFILFFFPFLVLFFIVNGYNFFPWLCIVAYLIYYFNRPDVKRCFI